MKEYLQQFDAAFRAIVSVNDDNRLAAEAPGTGRHHQYDADIKRSRTILYSLSAFQHKTGGQQPC